MSLTATRADWSDAFSLVPSLEVAYVRHASVFTREVLDGLLRIGFLYPQQIIWNKGRTVLTRTHYWSFNKNPQLTNLVRGTPGSYPITSAVPEPSSLILLGIGILGLCFLGCKGKANPARTARSVG